MTLQSWVLSGDDLETASMALTDAIALTEALLDSETPPFKRTRTKDERELILRRRALLRRYTRAFRKLAKGLTLPDNPNAYTILTQGVLKTR